MMPESVRLSGRIDFRRSAARLAASAFALAAATAVPATTSPPAPDPAPWRALDFLVGAWEGTSRGEPGAATVEREYRFVLGGRFLEARNRSTYPPQPTNPEGELHEDWGLFSRDRIRGTFVLRQFNVEGFVNQYAMEAATEGTDRLVFVTEAIENLPAGWRARETYTRIGPDELVEEFAIAPPGGEFAIYSEARLRRRAP